MPKDVSEYLESTDFYDIPLDTDEIFYRRGLELPYTLSGVYTDLDLDLVYSGTRSTCCQINRRGKSFYDGRNNVS